MKIKIKASLDSLPKIIDKGDWIDLKAAEKYEFNQNDILKTVKYIPLDVRMKLPDGFEAILVARSSTPKKFGIIVPNAFGVIDNSYCGNRDEWKMAALAIRETVINKGDRICQFRIQLSQKATFWQKLKWLFSSKIEIESVNNLTNESRGGFGSTGK